MLPYRRQPVTTMPGHMTRMDTGVSASVIPPQ